MDWGRGLSFVRRDPNWLVKTLLGSVIGMVPILNFALTGYGLDVARNIYSGHETPLPEWGENFGDRWVRGLIATVIGFIYLLPLVVLGCGWAFITGAAGAAANEGTTGAGVGAALCLVPIFVVGGLLLFAMALIAQARYAVTNDFAEAMRFGSVLAELRTNPGQWVGILLMLIVLSFAFGIAFLFTCGLASFMSAYLILAQSHWIAQAYRQSSGALEPASGSF